MTNMQNNINFTSEQAWDASAAFNVVAFGYKRRFHASDASNLLETLSEIRTAVSAVHAARPVDFPYTELFPVSRSRAGYTFGPDAEHWLRSRYPVSTSVGTRPCTLKEYAEKYARVNSTEGETIFFSLSNEDQTALVTEIDRIATDVVTHANAAVASGLAKKAAYEKKREQDLSGVEWTTRKSGNWTPTDGADIHEYIHQVTINGHKFTLIEGDMFDAGAFLRFADGVRRTDSPEADRAYRIVATYGERAKGNLGMRIF